MKIAAAMDFPYDSDLEPYSFVRLPATSLRLQLACCKIDGHPCTFARLRFDGEGV